MKVVCLKNIWVDQFGNQSNKINPKKGEIYLVIGSCHEKNEIYFFLRGFDDTGYKSDGFREVDQTFGHVVCQTIEQQIELEKVIR